MYTSQENVRIVISLLKQYNIRNIVISPGGTNIPITQAVQDDPFFHCYSIPDERSAMYFAIGLYLQTGEVIATSCTSAQATRNYIPGLTEAFYKHAPILAITTAKLERFQYQDYMQAPDQCSLPKDAVKQSFDLPPITDENTRIQCIHRTKEAILEVTHRIPGPIQLNIRIIDNQQNKFEDIELPTIHPLHRYMAWDEWHLNELGNKKILIVIGEHRPFNQRQQKAIDLFCDTHNAVVYVNHLSNFRNKFSIQGNLLISCGGFKLLKPDLLITIGGQTGDYPIYGALQTIGNAEHWRIAEDGSYVDTYCKLSAIFECPDYFFFERMVGKVKNQHTYLEAWQQLNKTINYDVELPFSNLYVAQQFYTIIPQQSIMNFAILNSLRCWSYFPFNQTIQCHSNVSAFGIDGCNSMLIGESMNTDKLCFIVTGDLAFFYDMNVLGIRHIKNNIRILLINNSGGAEFKIMTHSWEKKIHVNEYISANGHNGTAKGWAENCGFKYLSAKTKAELSDLKEIFVSPSEQPILFEVTTKADDEVLAMDMLIQANTIDNALGKIHNTISKIIGEGNTRFLKKIIRK